MWKDWFFVLGNIAVFGSVHFQKQALLIPRYGRKAGARNFILQQETMNLSPSLHNVVWLKWRASAMRIRKVLIMSRKYVAFKISSTRLWCCVRWHFDEEVLKNATGERCIRADRCAKWNISFVMKAFIFIRSNETLMRKEYHRVQNNLSRFISRYILYNFSRAHTTGRAFRNYSSANVDFVLLAQWKKCFFDSPNPLFRRLLRERGGIACFSLFRPKRPPRCKYTSSEQRQLLRVSFPHFPREYVLYTRNGFRNAHTRDECNESASFLRYMNSDACRVRWKCAYLLWRIDFISTNRNFIHSHWKGYSAYIQIALKIIQDIIMSSNERY